MELNSTLANDIIALLNAELNSSRAQYNDAQSHRRALENENARLKAQIENLLHDRREESRDSLIPVKREPEHDLVPQYNASINHMQRQLAEVLVERESANEEYNRATSELQDEIATLRSKYKNLKAEKRECQEVIEELSNQLRTYTEKEEKLQAKTWEEYLPTTLLCDIDHGPIPAQPKLAASIPFSSTKRLQINELALSTCTSDGIFECNSHQVQWSRGRIALGVIVRPAFQYHPEKPKRIWQKVLSFIEMGQTKDMMYWNSSGWHYMGTYECITPTYPISMDKLKSLKCLDESNNILNHIVPRTDSLSPIQKGILLELCGAGILMFEFFGLKCVGYNEKLRDALVNSAPAQKQPVGKDRPRILTPTYLKRKRSHEHNDFGPKNKKP